MDDLSAMGYVAMLQDHPRFPIWTINPAMADTFKDHREKIVIAKHIALEKFEQAIVERGGTMHTKAAVIGITPELASAAMKTESIGLL